MRFPRQFALAAIVQMVASLYVPLAFGQPALLPDALTSEMPAELAGELRRIEPLVWSDPWRARTQLEALGAVQEDVDSSSNAESNPGPGQSVVTESAEYNLLLAQALLYLHVDEAFSAAVQAGRDANGSQTDRRTALALDVLEGVRLGRDGDFSRADDHLLSTQAAAQKAELTGIAVLAAAERGYALTLAGEHERSLQILQSAYEQALASGDRFLVAVVNEVFGVLYSYLDEVDDAVRYYRSALEEYLALGYSVYAAEAVYGIATTYRYARQWDAALASFERYREITAPRGDEHGRFSAAYGLGTTLADMGDCERARPELDAALAADGPLDYDAELLKRSAVCSAQDGERDAALSALAAAQTIIAGIEELRGTRWEIDLLQSEARVYAALGDFELAYSAQERFAEAEAAWIRRNASERRMAQRDALENARQALQIELLQEQARVRTLELARQARDLYLQRIGVALLVVAVILALGFAYWRWRESRRLHSLAIEDSLTGLANRRHIFEELEKLLGRLDQERGDVAVILLDIDDFKSINDRYGHPIGDVVLQSVAGALESALRPGDQIARIGGEEFMMLLPRTDAKAAMSVAWRLHECLQDLPLKEGGGKSLTVTASLGVASTRGWVRSVQALYSAADEALYRAKAAGKNRCEMASPKRPSRG